MRMDLVRGRERCSATTSEAAEIDFMNIKQQGSIPGQGCYRSTTGTHGLCIGRCMDRPLFHFNMFHNIWISEIQTGTQTK